LLRHELDTLQAKKKREVEKKKENKKKGKRKETEQY